MTIQYEVVIWTIINFALLYLVIKYLLLRPMLKHMDARNAKIASGLERTEKLREEKEAALLAAKETALLAAKERRERVTAEYNEAVQQCEEQRLNAEAENKMMFSARCEELEKEEQRIVSAVTDGTPVLADAVAKKLLEKGL